MKNKNEEINEYELERFTEAEREEVRKTEAELKRAADNIPTVDFATRFQRIKNDPRFAQKEKPRLRWLRWVPLAASCCVILVLAICIPLFLNKPPITYLEKEIRIEDVNEDTFYFGLQEYKINTVDLSEYSKLKYRLFFVEDSVVVGGRVELYNQNNATEYIEFAFYSSVVSVSEDEYDDYNLSYTVGKTKVVYQLGGTIPAGGSEWYTYNAYVWHEDLVYKIKYTGIDGGFIPFIDNVFA